MVVDHPSNEFPSRDSSDHSGIADIVAPETTVDGRVDVVESSAAVVSSHVQEKTAKDEMINDGEQLHLLGKHTDVMEAVSEEVVALSASSDKFDSDDVSENAAPGKVQRSIEDKRLADFMPFVHDSPSEDGKLQCSPEGGASSSPHCKDHERTLEATTPCSLPPTMTRPRSAVAHVRTERLPGAYAEVSWRNPAAGIQDHATTVTQPDASSTPFPENNNNDGMVEATPVADDGNENLMEAQPVNSETRGIQSGPKLDRRSRLAMVVLVLLIPIIAIAVVVGVLAGRRNDKTPFPTAAPRATFPQDYPTPLPSSAPTEVLELFVTKLPQYTQDSILVDPLSPQNAALDWLSTHRNITHMEDWRKLQLFAMATFFYAMDGPNWPIIVQDHWLDDTKHECDWFSSGYGLFDEDGSFDYADTRTVYPCNDQQEFTSMYFDKVNFNDAYKPFLPPEIALLTSLTQIWFVGCGIENSLESFLPDQLNNMSSLGNIFLVDNYFTGTLPTVLAAMTSLVFLSLSENLLTGTIPSEIASMPILANFYLNTNSLTGDIPVELFMHPSLATLVLEENLFNPSTIPTEIGMSGLVTLHLADCNLSGAIPSQIGINSNLSWLNLRNNFLTGSIPSQVGGLPLLAVEIGHNILTGHLPTEFRFMMAPSLLMIHLQDNEMTGPLPSELGLLQEVQWLDLHNNPWTGTIPTEYGLLEDLAMLDLSTSDLTGSIPVELGRLANMYNLSQFHIDGTMVSGLIPQSLCLLTEDGCMASPSWLDYEFRTSRDCTLKFDCDDHQLCGCNCRCGNFSETSIANNNATA